MKLTELLQVVPGAEVTGDTSCEITGLSCDSRFADEGHLFFALRGSKTAGGKFIPEALARGAVAVLSDKTQTELDVPLVRVEQPRKAMARIAREFYGRPDAQLKAVGITGTNGKTTTAFIVQHLLRSMSQNGLDCGLIGTVRIEIAGREIPARMTTPESLDLFRLFRAMADSGCGSVAMEVSSHALAQNRVESLDFDVAIFTNLTQDHLDFHRTMEDYFAAKETLFTTLGQGEKKAYAILNVDDEYGRRLNQSTDCKVPRITYGENGGDLQWQLVFRQATGSRAKFIYNGQSVFVNLPLHGQFNIANAAAALAAGLALGGNLEALAKALESTPPVPGRLEPVTNDKGIQVFVDYAHTDDALRKALETARKIPYRRIITVFGCGGSRDSGKRPLMGALASQMSDVVFVTTDNPREEEPQEIIDDILFGMSSREHVRVMLDRREAIFAAIAEAKAEDIVLIAGKGHEDYQEIKGVRHPFDDRKIAAEALALK